MTAVSGELVASVCNTSERTPIHSDGQDQDRTRSAQRTESRYPPATDSSIFGIDRQCSAGVPLRKQRPFRVPAPAQEPSKWPDTPGHPAAFGRSWRQPIAALLRQRKQRAGAVLITDAGLNFGVIRSRTVRRFFQVRSGGVSINIGNCQTASCQ